MRFPSLPFGRKPTAKPDPIGGVSTPANTDGSAPALSSAAKNEHRAPHVVAVDGSDNDRSLAQPRPVEDYIEQNPKNKRWYAYYLTRDFYFVLLLG
jgi:hypothetical protein